MPNYEYKCEPCKVIYRTSHGMNESPELTCERCDKPLERMISAPSLNMGGWSSPTEAKYAKMTARDEIGREKQLQKNYDAVWLPPKVKHSPWDDDH